MGRLIDADALMKRKQEEHGYYDITDSEFEDLVNSQPTAYSVEKVVEQEENFLVNFGVPKDTKVHRKIIDICWAHLNKNCDNCDSKEIEVTDVIRIANELAEEYNGGWIPVSSGKLPDDGVPVEVTVKEDNDNGGYDLYVFESWYQDGQWVIGKNRYNPMVTAWKPKDAPYQPKGENELYRAKSVDGVYQEYNEDWK